MSNDLHEHHHRIAPITIDLDPGVGPSGRAGTGADQLLRRALERSERFHRDTLLGGLFHIGKHSFRELEATDAVHITLDGNRLSAHVDAVSPVKQGRDGRNRYSWARILVHNVLGIGTDLLRRLRGRGGEQRCNLDCEVVWVDDDDGAEIRVEEPECHTCTGDETPITPAVGRE